MKIEYYAMSDIGKKYKHNEDFYTLPEMDKNTLNLDSHRLFVLCDGVGGANAGEVAGKLCSEWLQRDFNNLSLNDRQKNISITVSNLIKDISKKINKLSKDYAEYKNMMTTIVSALFYQEKLYLHSIGDSRCYLLRNNKFEQLTDDDSQIWDLYKSGEISKDDLRTHPRKNIITNAVGADDEFSIHIYEKEILVNDLFLMCSDGLSDMISDEDIFQFINSEQDLKQSALKLVNKANEAGGKDNITLILIEVKG